MKLGGVVDKEGNSAVAQRDLNKLWKWADRSLLKFNEVLHLGRNPVHQYTRGADWLQSSSAERSLRFLIDSTLNMSVQCVVKKANSLLGCIRKSITRRLREVNIPLCSVLVRTHLKYWVQLWYKKKDTDRLERVWRRNPKTN